MTNEDQNQIREEPTPIAFSDFLESIPPSSALTAVAGLFKNSPGVATQLATPDVQLHCPSDTCNGTRFFVLTATNAHSSVTKEIYYTLHQCANCRKSQKTFSILAVQHEKGTDSGKCCKLGELPLYGPPTPSQLIKLVGPDRELFLKGRRAENHGLGIGAFVYYRRVVENNRILDEIIKVSTKLGSAPEAIQELEAAKLETQFSKASRALRTLFHRRC